MSEKKYIQGFRTFPANRNAITAIDTSSGSFNIDTLNLSKKVYDMLNRIASQEEVMMTGWTQFIHMTDTKKLKALCIWVD